jgi:hypothetical protein
MCDGEKEFMREIIPDKLAGYFGPIFGPLALIPGFPVI